ncbi:MAG: DUF4961 domain-containing protein [Dysgonamonadaceae bacterium]|jgi:hypothetical protein|nr:DUF4961 domain-containing protein [Dysgonamonadaceae bacterium]
MKRFKKYWLLLIAASCLVVTCMSIEDIVHPANAVINSDIEIVVYIKFDAGTNDGGNHSRLAFGVLAPKSWDIANSATLTLTTTALFAGNVVTNEPLTLIPGTDTRDGKSWPEFLLDTYGVMDNEEEMEWVAFESSTSFQIHDTEDGGVKKVVNGTINIKLHTGNTPMKPIMGYASRGKDSGRGDDGASSSKLLEVKDARSASFGPASFGFGDIFSITYVEAHVQPAAGAHRGGDVYLLGKVTYEIDGVADEKTVDETSDKTLMEDLGELNQANSWQKYIYPKTCFDLPDNAVITEIVVQFANQDKSIITDDFTVEPNCQ